MLHLSCAAGSDAPSDGGELLRLNCFPCSLKSTLLKMVLQCFLM